MPEPPGRCPRTVERRVAFAGGSDLLKVGLVGVGGRGTGAAEQALNADPATELVALGDVFEDAVARGRRQLSRQFNTRWTEGSSHRH